MELAAACEPNIVVSRGWKARIELLAELVAPRTILRSVKHQGPLRVQRAFYPERDGTCHLLLLHPPGGVVGGDELDVMLCVDQAASVLLTTPGATKIYRCEQARSKLNTRIRVRAGGRCEWLPQETILFNGARTTVSTKVQLERDACFIGWDVLCFGRPASGESFERGEVISRLEIHRDDQVLFNERLSVRGNSAVLEQAWGLDGRCAIGTLLIAVPDSQELTKAMREALQACRSDRALPGDSRVNAELSGTELEDVFVFRARGTSAEDVKRVLATAWQVARQRLGADGGYWPRIWFT